MPGCPTDKYEVRGGKKATKKPLSSTGPLYVPKERPPHFSNGCLENMTYQELRKYSGV